MRLLNISDVTTWRVLVVDDEPDSNETVKLVLMAAGAEVYEASNGLEGIEIFKQKQPNIVLTDIAMPEVDGWELLKQIRVLTNGAQKVPMIALTAHAMVGDKDRVLQAGFNGYLKKPLHMMTLIESVTGCLK